MRRRDFLALLAVATVVPAVASAQQKPMPVIGILVHEALGSEQFRTLFPQAMRNLGYVEAQTVRFEFRSDEGQVSRLPELAAELAQLHVDLIVPWFTPAAGAVRQATREIPIVCAACGDPVGTGLVQSLARPGGNVTGIAAVAAELAGKSVELIREVVPTARRIVVLVNAPDPFSKPFLRQVQLAGNSTQNDD